MSFIKFIITIKDLKIEKKNPHTRLIYILKNGSFIKKYFQQLYYAIAQ